MLQCCLPMLRAARSRLRCCDAVATVLRCCVAGAAVAFCVAACAMLQSPMLRGWDLAAAAAATATTLDRRLSSAATGLQY
jgi:hypothetical protein